MLDIGLVFFGWALSQLSDLKNRDMVAKEKCLQSLSELEEIFTKAENLYSNWETTPQKSHELLMEIKKVIKRLKIERLELMIFSYQLNDYLSKIIGILDQYDPQHENQAYHPNQTLGRVQMASKSADDTRIKNNKLHNIQVELIKHLCVRILKSSFFSIKNLLKEQEND